MNDTTTLSSIQLEMIRLLAIWTELGDAQGKCCRCACEENEPQKARAAELHAQFREACRDILKSSPGQRLISETALGRLRSLGDACRDAIQDYLVSDDGP
jgi:hypothetical protein